MPFVFSCAKTVTGGSDGESHFLRSCDATCEGGLSCICGVCTASCEEDKTCDAIFPGATCVDHNASEMCSPDKDADNSTSAVCDFICDSSKECSMLGANYKCVTGLCRMGNSSPTSLIDSGGNDTNGNWEVVESNTTEGLHSIWGSADDDIWAAGESLILHYDGQTWEIAFEDKRLSINDIWGSASDDIWAVGYKKDGDNADQSTAMMLHYNGIEWQENRFEEISPVLLGVVGGFHAVWGTSANDIYAFVSNVPGWQLPWHWNGSVWNQIDDESVAIESSDLVFGNSIDVSGTSPDNIVVAANTVVLFDGIQWKVLDGVQEASAAWALSNGDILLGELNRGIERYRNGSVNMELSLIHLAAEGLYNINDFWGFSDSDIYVVASWTRGKDPYATAHIYHYDGSTWSEQDLDGLRVALSAVWGSASGELWVVGAQGTILRRLPMR